MEALFRLMLSLMYSMSRKFILFALNDIENLRYLFLELMQF